MRLMVGTTQGVPGGRVFLIDERGAADLSAADARVGADLMRIARDPGLAATAAQAAGTARIDPALITPALPIEAPGKVVCLGLNYAEHAREGGFEVPDYPALFMRARSSLIAAEAALIRPNASETLDYEAELMVIIGKPARHVTQADALDHVFGYTVFNDGSVRAYQHKTHQWTAGKNFDATGAVGPVVVTPDEIAPGATGLRIQSRLNGQIMQDSNTSDMIFPVARTIAILSEVMTLESGDMIAMGTPPGVGHARKPPVWMRPGDVVEAEIEGIGLCRNPVVAEVGA
ncbi:MAG: fumarylacetoacetate hydrolase family protein [Rhodobacteraceae bacterium]|nr:fumarylacetoacetate hydrolase family protein [Paracoccaceae bacterium]